MVDVALILILFMLGIVFAILATIVGIGGGLLYVPTLIFLFLIDANDATLISSFAIVFTSFSGAYKYYKSQRIDIRTGLMYLGLAIPGSIIGGLVADIIDETVLKKLFAVFIGISAVRGIMRAYITRNESSYQPTNISQIVPEILNKPLKKFERRIIDSSGDVYQYNAKITIGLIFALLGGFLAGMLGIGGGIIFVPLLGMITGLPIHVAVATSTSMITLVSLMSVVTRFSNRAIMGTLDLGFILSYGIPLSIGAIIGAYIGAAKVKQVKSKVVILLFWIVALGAAIRMFLT